MPAQWFLINMTPPFYEAYNKDIIAAMRYEPNMYKSVLKNMEFKMLWIKLNFNGTPIFDVPALSSISYDSQVGQIVANTNSFSPNLIYNLDNCTNIFKIDESGTISILNPKFKRSLYKLDIRAACPHRAAGASDQEGIFLTRTITVVITDIPIKIADQHVSVYENVHIGYIIASIIPTSPIQAGSSITYTLINSYDVFEIHNNGLVTLKNNLDYEIRNEYNLKIIATDSITDTSDNANITVTVKKHK